MTNVLIGPYWQHTVTRLCRAVWLLTMLVPLGACGLSGGPLSGQVLEEGTLRPVQGAVVVVRWQGDLPAFAETRTVCYHVESAITNEAGRYHIPAWSKGAEKDWQRWIINKGYTTAAYKAGYWSPAKPSQKEQVTYLATFKGQRGERFDYLSRIISGTSCGSAGESYKNLHRLMIAVYDEAIGIAQSVDEKRRAQLFKEIAEDALGKRSKPATYDKHGQPLIVDPKVTLKTEYVK